MSRLKKAAEAAGILCANGAPGLLASARQKLAFFANLSLPMKRRSNGRMLEWIAMLTIRAETATQADTCTRSTILVGRRGLLTSSAR